MQLKGLFLARAYRGVTVRKPIPATDAPAATWPIHLRKLTHELVQVHCDFLPSNFSFFRDLMLACLTVSHYSERYRLRTESINTTVRRITPTISTTGIITLKKVPFNKDGLRTNVSTVNKSEGVSNNTSKPATNTPLRPTNHQEIW